MSAESAEIATRKRNPNGAGTAHTIQLLQGAFLAIGQEGKATPLIQLARDIAAAQIGNT